MANLPIDPADTEISFYKSSGPGGQKKNTTESAVRVRHIPTGITVVSTSSRSQHQNKRLALQELERRLARRRKRRKPRIATKATRSSGERRIQGKKRQGKIKKLRQSPTEE